MRKIRSIGRLRNALLFKRLKYTNPVDEYVSQLFVVFRYIDNPYECVCNTTDVPCYYYSVEKGYEYYLSFGPSRWEWLADTELMRIRLRVETEDLEYDYEVRADKEDLSYIKTMLLFKFKGNNALKNTLAVMDQYKSVL